MQLPSAVKAIPKYVIIKQNLPDSLIYLLNLDLLYFFPQTYKISQFILNAFTTAV